MFRKCASQAPSKEIFAEVAYKYVFGPVNSSRLGLSLGLDCLGDTKTCSLDCVYCEVGPTRRLTLKRGPYVEPGEVLGELAHWRDRAGRGPEYLTLGGRGEPCLNSGLAEIIRGAREILPGVPVAVLTNSTLLSDPEVRADLAAADAVLPSLDTLSNREFKALNQPHPRLSLDSMAQGLMDFRQMYAGRLFLEVLLVRGINDNEENLRRLGDYVAGLRPDRIDVSTMTRPGSERQAGPADGEILERFRSVLGDRKTRERKRSPSATKDIFRTDDPERIKEQVLASLSRRPQTAADLASALDLHEAAVLEALEDLTASGAITAEDQGERFYHGPF